MELNRLTTIIHKHIREFRIEKFRNDVQEAGNSGKICKLANRIKVSRITANSPIHGRGEIKYGALGKAKSVAKCLEDQFTANDSDDKFRYHYKQVRRGVQHFRDTKFDSCVEPVTSNEVRKIIKNLSILKLQVTTEFATV